MHVLPFRDPPLAAPGALGLVDEMVFDLVEEILRYDEQLGQQLLSRVGLRAEPSV